MGKSKKALRRHWTKNNARRAQLLGMPLGTANNRLRRIILLSLTQQLGIDYCFRCSRKIETVAELSIEHKKSWQSSINPVEAFFSLANITFSHLTCNIRENGRPTLTPLELIELKEARRNRRNSVRRLRRAKKRAEKLNK